MSLIICQVHVKQLAIGFQICQVHVKQLAIGFHICISSAREEVCYRVSASFTLLMLVIKKIFYFFPLPNFDLLIQPSIDNNYIM